MARLDQHVVGARDTHPRVAHVVDQVQPEQHAGRVGQLLELHVVVEVTQPRLLVGRVDVAPQAVLLVPAPLPLASWILLSPT